MDSNNYLSKESKLFIVLGCFLIANAILAEFIGVKIFSVEESLGFKALQEVYRRFKS